MTATPYPLSTTQEAAPESFLHRPTIEESESRNVTAVVGTTAMLSCRVKNVGKKTVSGWVELGEWVEWVEWDKWMWV